MTTRMSAMEKAEKTKLKRVRLYAVDEDETYLDLCSAVFQLKAPITLLGVLRSHDISALKQILVNLLPDVVLISIKDLGGDIIKELEQFRTDHPRIGIVLLLEACNPKDTEHLRRVALFKGTGGTAILLKQPPDRLDWLCSAISAVGQGQLILDASLAAYMFAGKPGYSFLKQFTPRELEILTLLANGFTNSAIAKVLYIDIKTVEHHLNNMYSKLKENYEFVDKHLRVSVAKLFLDAIGESGAGKNLIVRS